MDNEKQTIIEPCIGNPPYKEALGITGGGDEMLTEAQQNFFDEKKELVRNLPEDATDREKKLAKTALFFVKYAEDLQKAINKQRMQSAAAAAAAERKQRRSELSKAWGVMTACYRAIDRHFGDQIRAQLAYNDETAKQGQIRKPTAELERIAKK